MRITTHQFLKTFPMISLNRPLLRLYATGFFLLLLTSCNSTHKLQQKSSQKMTATDKTETEKFKNSQTIITEKANTLIKIKGRYGNGKHLRTQ